MSKPTSTLRQTYINELTLRGLSPRTIECYVGWVYDLARCYKPPDQLNDGQLRLTCCTCGPNGSCEVVASTRPSTACVAFIRWCWDGRKLS